jgi:integrase
MKMSKTTKTKIFSTWAKQWLELVKPTVKGNTYAASYKNPVENHLIPYFGRKQLTSIQQEDIQRYMSIVVKKYSVDTVMKHKSCLFQIFEIAVNNDYCLKNPVRNIKIRHTKKREEKYVYTEEQIKLVFNYAYSHRFGAEVQFMLATGVSRSELLALKWCNVNLEERVVYIRHGAALVPNEETGVSETVIGDTKNEYRKRDIPIEPEICRILNEIPRDSIFVFCNKYGNNHRPSSWFKRRFKVFMKEIAAFNRTVFDALFILGIAMSPKFPKFAD